MSVSRHGPASALASTGDFRTFERHGVLFCPENKDVVLFPARIGGTFAALHRPVCGTPFTRPEMWVARIADLIHWGEHAPLTVSGGEWQSGRVRPARRSASPDGWLEIYHGNRRPTRTGEVGAYYARGDPPRPGRPGPGLVGGPPSRSSTPRPTSSVAGFVPNVVFPTGVVRDRKAILVYYGAADAFTAVAEFSEHDLLERHDHDGRDRGMMQVLDGSLHGRVMALSTSSSGTVANVLA